MDIFLISYLTSKLNGLYRKYISSSLGVTHTIIRFIIDVILFTVVFLIFKSLFMHPVRDYMYLIIPMIFGILSIMYLMYKQNIVKSIIDSRWIYLVFVIGIVMSIVTKSEIILLLVSLLGVHYLHDPILSNNSYLPYTLLLSTIFLVISIIIIFASYSEFVEKIKKRTGKKPELSGSYDIMYENLTLTIGNYLLFGMLMVLSYYKTEDIGEINKLLNKEDKIIYWPMITRGISYISGFLLLLLTSTEIINSTGFINISRNSG